MYKHNGVTYCREGDCLRCGKCCKELVIETEMENDDLMGKNKQMVITQMKEEEKEAYKKKGYKNINIGRVTWLTNKKIKFDIELDCPFLKNNKCSIHNNKPKHCREFPTPGVRRPKGCGYSFKKIK